jgi:hypothetical protein
MPESSAPAAEPLPDVPNVVYHLKVILMEVTPRIWRSFQVPASMTLASLHRTLQIVMGWDNFHLHKFYITGETYGSWELSDAKDEHCQIGEIVEPVSDARSVFLYEYDMGDLWQHEIRVEKVTRPNRKHRYPRCTAGAWKAPPEDCGGPEAFRRIARRRKKNVFSVDEVNEELRHAFGLEVETSKPRKSKRAKGTRGSGAAKRRQSPRRNGKQAARGLLHRFADAVDASRAGVPLVEPPATDRTANGQGAQERRSARRRTESGERVSGYVPPTMAEALRVRCANERQSLSEALTEALSAWVKR